MKHRNNRIVTLAALTLAALSALSGCRLHYRGGYAPVDATPAVAEETAEPAPEAAPPPAPEENAEKATERDKIVKEAGPIWSNDDAQGKCPVTCGELDWEGVWWTTEFGRMSVCECLASSHPSALN